MNTYPIIRLQETESTSLYLKECLKQGPLAEGTVVTAAYQSAGRGQRGTSWESAPGENLTFSIYLEPRALPAARHFSLSQAISLAVKKVLDRHTAGISIKWPNDIYHRDKKISGILIENSLLGPVIQSSIAGIGINLNQTNFVTPAPNPVSLRQITGASYRPEEILDHFIQTFFPLYLKLLKEETAAIEAAYLTALYRGTEKFYPYRDATGDFQARITGISPSGHLLLQLPNGQARRYAFKEITFII
jgi:BirA family biotin operon repressor/biotin-[acetyl-CoA-carboxylase] ligase